MKVIEGDTKERGPDIIQPRRVIEKIVLPAGQFLQHPEDIFILPARLYLSGPRSLVSPSMTLHTYTENAGNHEDQRGICHPGVRCERRKDEPERKCNDVQ